MWAHLVSGGAGSGMCWPARNPHVLTTGMKRALASLAGFSKLVDWRRFSPRALAADEAEVNAHSVQLFACREQDQAVLWLLRGDAENAAPGVLPRYDPLHNVSVDLRGWQSGTYAVEQWDTNEGCSRGCLCAAVNSDSLL